MDILQVFLFLGTLTVGISLSQGSETDAKKWLKEYNTAVGDILNKQVDTDWAYNTDITAAHQTELVDINVKVSMFEKEASQNVSTFDWKDFKDADIRRQMKKISDIGPSALKDPQKVKLLNEAQSDMQSIYSKATIFLNNKTLNLEPGITEIFAKSRDYMELSDVWRLWRDASGAKMKSLYQQMVELSNEGSRENGYSDTGAYWRTAYEDADFQDTVEELLVQLKPLYTELHTYVRKKLIALYGKDKFPPSGHIPAHILGNMWAQSWNNIYDVVIPFHNKPSVDVTNALIEQNYTAERMFKTAESFFTSLKLERMVDTFWTKSMLTRPSGEREVVCHASAWDFYDALDFRIKMCTKINMEDLITIHHEMGHVEYFQLYKDQPEVYRDGANPGFHEAIGDTVALSVSTPKHLREIKLLKPGDDDPEAELNFLMSMALDKIAFLPFGYLIDQWRWSVFSGETKPDEYNQKWWDLRCKYQGIASPIKRTQPDFDPGAKFHIPANVPYIRYFVSFVIQFQFHQALCKAAGHTGPLHRCDIYKSDPAGQLLRKALTLGSSKRWSEVMEILTGQTKMDTGPLQEYFKPLTIWLKEQNKNEKKGWTDNCPENDVDASKFLDIYNTKVQNITYRRSLASWKYSTNITDENEQERLRGEMEASQFTKEMARKADKIDWRHLYNSNHRRQFKFITNIGPDAMKNTTKIARLNEVITKMEGIFSKGKVCLDNKSKTACLKYEPGISRIFSTSRDYDKLKTVWKEWRDSTGKQMKTLYQELVELSNEGVKELGFKDTAEYWKDVYETPTFEKDLEELLIQLQPLYRQLHTYVRKELRKVYGPDKFPKTGHIPAHLLGNIWAQEWQNVLPLVQPFKHKASVDITSVLKKKNFSVKQMFETAEGFYKSIGLDSMPESFWNGSMLSRPGDGREVVCYAAAWDMGNAKDFRIKMCTDITMEDLITIHHEMGHVEYFLQYKDQPSVFRSGANPGFHEAIGDTMALSASTPKHLRKIGLLPEGPSDYENDINYLMKTALEKIAFLPFGYLIDQWRWSVFSGETKPDEYNTKWWDLRCKYQGINPPVQRSKDDFDPGAKYHVASNVPYIRYFVSFVIQFQFHQALCKTANQTGPLHTCDIYKSKEAGTKLRNMLKLGYSVQWQDAMELMTGQRKMDVAPLIEYFKPLLGWLEMENKGESEGWTDVCPDPNTGGITDVKLADQFLKKYSKRAAEVYYKSAILSWNYNTNLTKYNSKLKTEYSLITSAFSKEVSVNASMFDWKKLPNELMRREFESVTARGTSAFKDINKLRRLRQLKNAMKGIYSKGEVCLSGHKECMNLEPGLTRLLRSSRNYSELTEVWTGWRDATGKKLKPLYEEFVELSNEAYRDAGYNNTAEAWIKRYETETMENDLEELLQQLKPLYQQLHSYVRRKLITNYGKDNFPKSGHIPAHLLGNMWAQSWSNIFSLLEPYPGKISVDVTPEMLKQNYTVLKMFRTAEEFFLSLGLKKIPDNFWNNSMLEKPTDGRDVVCHASAWDFNSGNDFRIKMCTDINMEDLITIHHELGHIQYYLQYADQSFSFEGGANPGFHEAVGDVLALSVATPGHLHKIGLIPTLTEDTETDINFLMSMALDKIAFLPFGYLIDQWRWSVFRGETPPVDYTRQWWNLRCKHQGISPPVVRDDMDFDPGAKYHVASNTPYIRYFVSFVIQFQFHQALCKAANHTGPLYKCDIYNSKEAGKKLAAMLSLGTSKPWQDAMEEITGQRKMDVRPLVEYFKPLLQWLEKENEGQPFGWSESCPTGLDGSIRDLNSARTWLQDYNNKASEVTHAATVAEYNYNVNITDENSKQKVDMNLVAAEFDKKSAEKADTFDWKNYPEGLTKRQFQKVTDIGTSAMKNSSKLERMETLRSQLEAMYSVGMVTMSDGRKLELEPGLTKIMAKSRDYAELLEAWKGWRDSTGKHMKSKYEEFVNLSNEGVRELDYKDTGDYWRSWYETESFQQDLDNLLGQLKPLYVQLHGYVRKQLKKVYGETKFPYSGHIPAHILGNMWGQTWNNIYDLVVPFKNKTSLSVTDEMIRQEYTVEKMFWTAEDFFKSLGLEQMPPEFWKYSMIRKPTDRDVVCHASAWDFYNKKDFRIKMCTEVNMEYLITIHHEMGHIQYYLQYKDQPTVFRRGANHGFHEAIGDTMALSASTPNHLKSIGLLETVPKDAESDINFLMKMALEKIAFLPFGYLIDQWRWSVFSGETPKNKYNTKWWELRCKHQGLSPPIGRSEDDFDPGAKFHVPSNMPYIRYFVSYVLQFQFHKGLCEAANHTGTLRTCDIYGSKAAGMKLANMLKLGSSKPWPEALKMVTGTNKMDASALMEYFQPLIDWLQKENAGEDLGWNENCPQDDLVQHDAWLKLYDKHAEKATYNMYVGDWSYQTNITEQTSQMSVQGRLGLDYFKKSSAAEASKIDWKNIKDERMKRLFSKITNIGTSAMKNNASLIKMQQLQSKMEGVYGSATVCLSGSKCLPLEPDLTQMMAKERNYGKLQDIWKSWRDKTGKLMKDSYSEFVALSNEGVKELGYGDTGEYWRSAFESATFEEDLKQLLKQLHPLYQQLHTYVRSKLMKVYPASKFPISGHIPAHLLGNMWAQQWNNIYDIVQPFKNRSSVDVTPAMKTQNYTVVRMFRTAEDFFTSLGLKKMPPSFWRDSMLEKPKDGREVVCHASAWDFYNAKDFRIKMCTDVNMEDLITVHHEMGHIQYFLQYDNLPQPFRDGANPGFHEAVGDTLALSVSTPNHLKKLGLMENGEYSELDNINFLMKMALEKIAFLPFGYLIDQWRWSVFSGETPKDKYNTKWWELRCKYQGIFPPVQRSETDFDPGAKYHIPDNTPYIRYFVSFVIQFQFHQALCKAAGHTGPLHECDIYQSKNAGKLLGDMLRLGASKPWPEAMEIITGQKKMDVFPLIEYFKPLMKWLETENINERPGWSDSCPDADDFPPVAKVDKNGGQVSGTVIMSSSKLTFLLISYIFIQMVLSVN